jgi:hypothetical protein
MNSLKLLIVLFISISIIYLVLSRISIQNEMLENFENNINKNDIPKNEIATKLGIDVNRIHNYVESGDENDTNDFQINFDIYPRTLNKKNNPTINQIQEKINTMMSDKDILQIPISTGKIMYFKKIKINQVKLNSNNKEIEKEKNQYVDPSIDNQIKYLNAQKSGFLKEISIEPRYKFNNTGKLELIPIPTPTVRVTPSPTSTSTKK